MPAYYTTVMPLPSPQKTQELLDQLQKMLPDGIHKVVNGFLCSYVSDSMPLFQPLTKFYDELQYPYVILLPDDWDGQESITLTADIEELQLNNVIQFIWETNKNWNKLHPVKTNADINTHENMMRLLREPLAATLKHHDIDIY